MALASCSSKSSTAANPTNFSDSDAKALITDYLNSWAREPLTVDMGEYAALEHNPFDPDPTLHKGQIWSETFKGFRSLEEAGIVKIHNVRHYGGVITEFSMDPGSNAADFRCSQTRENDAAAGAIVVGGPRRLCIPSGRGTLTRIVRSESATAGADDYRLIMATFKWDWHPVLATFCSTVDGRPVSSNRKMSVLFKHDPFAAKWNPTRSDFANADEEFRTQNTFSFVTENAMRQNFEKLRQSKQ